MPQFYLPFTIGRDRSRTIASTHLETRNPRRSFSDFQFFIAHALLTPCCRIAPASSKLTHPRWHLDPSVRYELFSFFLIQFFLLLQMCYTLHRLMIFRAKLVVRLVSIHLFLFSAVPANPFQDTITPLRKTRLRKALQLISFLTLCILNTFIRTI